MNPIKIDVVSDVACPWCYVGKKRLEAALEQWNGAPVEVVWHPFQLDPGMRAEGMDYTSYLTNKFGSVERVRQMTDHLTEVGKSVGIDFNFGSDWLAVNTFPLHQLLLAAREEGFGSALKEQFLKGYFEETRHLNQRQELYEILGNFGWSQEKVDSVLADETIAAKVKSEIAYYQQRGVTGVPFFVFNDQYGMSGAQPTDVILEALAALTPMENFQDGESCDPSTGNC